MVKSCFTRSFVGGQTFSRVLIHHAQESKGASVVRAVVQVELSDRFPHEAAARDWFEKQLWPQGPVCPYCGSSNVQTNIKHKTMTHRCRECLDRRIFSLRTGTVMEGSKLKYRVWAIAIYLLTTNLKGVSSMKLHRDLKVCQKSAWLLVHRIRKAWHYETVGKFAGPVEVDETYIGGKEKNKHVNKRLHSRGGHRRLRTGQPPAVGDRHYRSNLEGQQTCQQRAWRKGKLPEV